MPRNAAKVHVALNNLQIGSANAGPMDAYQFVVRAGHGARVIARKCQ